MAVDDSAAHKDTVPFFIRGTEENIRVIEEIAGLCSVESCTTAK